MPRATTASSATATREALARGSTKELVFRVVKHRPRVRVSEAGDEPDHLKVEAIRRWPPPLLGRTPRSPLVPHLTTATSTLFVRIAALLMNQLEKDKQHTRMGSEHTAT